MTAEYRVWAAAGEHDWHGLVFSSSGAPVVPSDAETEAAFREVTQPARPASMTPAPAPPADPPYSFAPVFYPSTSDPLAATVVALAAGEERDGIDLRMQFVPTFKIAGVVFDRTACRAMRNGAIPEQPSPR
jgi:hypothetical protein